MLKKMNKMVLLMVLLMAVLVTGCSRVEKKVVDSNKKETTQETEKEETTNNKTEKEAEETEEPYEKGVRTDTTYENKALNLKFTLPEGFLMATDDEMAQILGTGLDMQNLTEAQKAAAEQLLYEMLAQNPADGSNVVVITEKLPLESLEEKQYLQISLDSAVSANTASGIEVQPFGEMTEEELGGQTFLKSGMRTTVNGIIMIQEMLVKKADGHMVTITLSYAEGNEAIKDTMAGAFEPFA